MTPKPCRICGFTGDHKVGCPLKPGEKSPHPCQWCGYVGEHESICPLGKKESGGIINMSGIGTGEDVNPPVSGNSENIAREKPISRISPEEATRTFLKKQLPHLASERIEELVRKEMGKETGKEIGGAGDKGVKK